MRRHGLFTFAAAVCMSVFLLTSAVSAGEMEGVMMKDGKMMMMKDGKAMGPMDAEMTMSNGTKVMTDGKAMMKDGKEMMMKDGMMMMMDGKMMEGGKPMEMTK